MCLSKVCNLETTIIRNIYINTLITNPWVFLNKSNSKKLTFFKTKYYFCNVNIKKIYLLPSILSSHVLAKYIVITQEQHQNSLFYLPKATTKYGKFNIRFQGPKIWNLINHQNKSFFLNQFKKKMKHEIVCKY